MKGVVAYDSVHGNTKQVAEAIADEIRSAGHETLLIDIKASSSSVEGDFMFVGSPTRAGRMTGDVKKFLESLNVSAWRGKPIIMFDTIGPLSKDPVKRKQWLETAGQGDKNAASKMREICINKGLSCSKIFHIAVVGFLGPLAPDAIEIAREQTRNILAGLK